MADLLTGSSPLNGAYVPFSGLAGEDRRLMAEDPETSFAGLLQKSLAEKPAEESGAKSAAGPERRKPLIDKTSPRFDAKLYEQCQTLEGFLIKTLLTTMRNTVQKSGLIDQDYAGEIYEDMLYDEYAKSYTQNAGFGLADQAYLELTGQRGKTISRYA